LRILSVVFYLTVFLSFFLILHTVHFLYFPVSVVLYVALLDVLISGVVVAVLDMIFRPLRWGMSGMETGLSLTIGCLLAMLYSFAIPTIIDRSLSIYILEKLAQRGGAIRLDAWEDIIKQEFMQEHRVVDIRLTEQLNSGTISIAQGCVRLTPWGAAIAYASRLYRTTLLPKRREIMGQLTDDLTDPFRRTPPSRPYECGP
jgi:hypothetical protein